MILSTRQMSAKGFSIAHLIAHSVVAEKAKLAHARGSMQSSCYACWFFGIMGAAPLPTYMHGTAGPYYIVLLLSLLPMRMLPLTYVLHEQVEAHEPHHGPVPRMRSARRQPMGFVYLHHTLSIRIRRRQLRHGCSSQQQRTHMVLLVFK